MAAPNTLLLAGLAAGVTYFGFIKPRRDRQRRAAESGENGTGGQARILFSTDCEWQIPDAWWTDVGQPKFSGILDNALAGAQTWDEKKAKLLEQGQAGGPLNSHNMAQAILTGETPDGCPLPPPQQDPFNPPVGQTVKQERMNNLWAHMINHVEASVMDFVNSQGTRVRFPVPLDEG